MQTLATILLAIGTVIYLVFLSPVINKIANKIKERKEKTQDL